MLEFDNCDAPQIDSIGRNRGFWPFDMEEPIPTPSNFISQYIVYSISAAIFEYTILDG